MAGVVVLCPMPAATFQQLHAVLRTLSLREGDFASGDAAVNRVADFKRAVESLDTTDEPWVADWLTAEHYKAGVLYAAAKTNWNKQQAGGTHGPFNVMTRAVIVERFNRWVSELEARLDAYECSSRSATDTAHWRGALARFRDDPVHNP